MTRSVNPTPDWHYTPGGFMYYYESGTNIPLTTYADSEHKIQNRHPVPLNERGSLPSVFFDGLARQVLENSNNEQLWERDPVGEAALTGEFAAFDPLITYNIPNICTGSDNKFYMSIINNNQGNDPTTPSPGSWSEVRFIGVYNSQESYSIGDVSQESDGSLWASQVNLNTGNTPSLDGGSNWLPAVDGSKIAEIITLDTRTSTVIRHTGGGTLSVFRLNQLQDSSTYALPAASSVSDGQLLMVSLPSDFSDELPTIQRMGADTISAITGSDTDFTIDVGMSTFRFVSDGINTWSIEA